MTPSQESASAPQMYVDWINAHLGFNPRSKSASNALADFILADLRLLSSEIDSALRDGTLRSEKNLGITTAVADRDVDLVLVETAARKLTRLAVENKTIMAAHGKARKNRYGDLIAYCNHVHNHRRESIAGAVVVINTSPVYQNPDSFARYKCTRINARASGNS